MPLRLSALLLIVTAIFFVTPRSASAGWSFDASFAPEELAALLESSGLPLAPAGSWLRLREMDRSAVRDGSGVEVPPWEGVKPKGTIEQRRAALLQLRDRGYRLVAFIRWPSESWEHNTRTEPSLRRLPLDLREAFERSRRLAETYGDLIDYWEIENEPDIAFVEENPETYAAFLKACYLGIAAGRAPSTAHDQGSEVRDQRSDGTETNQVSGLESQVSALTSDRRPLTSDSQRAEHALSRVLMAPLALPPGPYFDAFVANDGLRYTDGFNYHYYGYAEDFTGVYQQFRDAVERTTAVTADNEAVLSTRFYPLETGWQVRPVATFGHTSEAAAGNRTRLQARPRATHEPALIPHGRWLVSPGTTVTETADGWRFEVAAPAPGPLIPARAELPLPDGFTLPLGSTLAMEYRAVPTAPPGVNGDLLMVNGVNTEITSIGARSDRPPSTASDAAALAVTYPFTNNREPITRASPAPRALPVLLTEYGYGLLGQVARNTAEGRAAQRAWFASVADQVHDLGIEGTMAFYLRPYFEANEKEFGLLMPAETTGERSEVRDQMSAGAEQTAEVGRKPEFRSSGVSGQSSEATQVSGLKSQVSPTSALTSDLRPLTSQPWVATGLAPLVPSPALLTLLEKGQRPTVRQDWTVTTAKPSAIVLDFVAETGLQRAKIRRGYLTKAATAAGSLLVYNFSSAPTMGSLTLTGDAWSFANGTKEILLALAPGERRTVPVTIALARGETFAPQLASALFRQKAEVRGQSPEGSESTQVSGLTSRVSPNPPMSAPTSGAAAPALASTFDLHVRTENGNLYQTWPRPVARESWRWYAESVESFTPAFYGRAYLPTPLSENKPAALVFFFRPERYPAVYEIRKMHAVEYRAR